MNSHQVQRLAAFVAGLNKLTLETGIRVDTEYSPFVLQPEPDVNDKYNVDWDESISGYRVTHSKD